MAAFSRHIVPRRETALSEDRRAIPTERFARYENGKAIFLIHETSRPADSARREGAPGRDPGSRPGINPPGARRRRDRRPPPAFRPPLLPGVFTLTDVMRPSAILADGNVACVKAPAKAAEFSWRAFANSFRHEKQGVRVDRTGRPVGFAGSGPPGSGVFTVASADRITSWRLSCAAFRRPRWRRRRRR